LEAARGALLGHRLGALNPGVIGTVRLNPGAQREHVDAFLRAGANSRNVDRIDKPWRRAVLELDNGEAAVDSGIKAEDSHDAPLNRLSRSSSPHAPHPGARSRANSSMRGTSPTRRSIRTRTSSGLRECSRIGANKTCSAPILWRL